MKVLAGIVLVISIASCADSNNSTDTTGTVEAIKDTNHIITDSVEMPDTNTAEIDPMKKRN